VKAIKTATTLPWFIANYPNLAATFQEYKRTRLLISLFGPISSAQDPLELTAHQIILSLDIAGAVAFAQDFQELSTTALSGAAQNSSTAYPACKRSRCVSQGGKTTKKTKLRRCERRRQNGVTR